MQQKYIARHWHFLEDGHIQCDICPNACKLKEGQRGVCFVRTREQDQIVLKHYGQVSGIAIDPVEKKPLNHFLPGSSVLSFGTIGCNLSCRFCQNWQISKAHDETQLSREFIAPEKMAEMAKTHDCDSVAFTYNEPIIFFEYAIEVAKACHALGINTIAVTNSYICEKPREEFFQHMDAANVDLKGFTEKFYHDVTYSKLKPVLDTLIYLKHHTNVWFEITTLLIPELNDSDAEIDAMTKWIHENIGDDVPLHFNAFMPCYKMQDVPATPPETLNHAREIALKNGLQYVYTGNVSPNENSNTYCVNCKQCLIKRTGYTISNVHVKSNGRCEFCDADCAGVFTVGRLEQLRN